MITNQRFAINDGIDGVYTLAEMLEVNYHDDEFCAWAKNADAGDIWPGLGEKCECIECDEVAA